jgi:threo-3-hydroxy-L-aspartate ammonia-lyase
MTLIPPYDHADVLTGQGTAVKELFDEVQAAGNDLDMLFVPVGGGGLLSGACLVAKARAPNCAVYGVEPATGNDAQQSLRSGNLVRIDTPQTIADGAQTQSLGALTFAIIRRDVTDIVTATDPQLIEAMRFCAERMKLIVEPTGVLGLAAICHAGLPIQGKRIGVVLSGGNVDMVKFGQWIS